jgi:AraC-like DNA-binding protein
VKKRLQEAYMLIGQQGQKPSGIYLELGFESLSHFSVAYKKMFGHSPATVTRTTISG